MNSDSGYLETNIAGRLVQLLEKIRSSNISDNTIYSGWVSIFECPKDPPDFAIQRALKASALISKVYDQMLKSDFPKEIYEKPLLSLYEIFSESFKNPSASWGNLKAQITDDKVAVMKMCAAIMDKSGNTFHISESQLDEFEKRTSEIIKYLMDLEINPFLKSRLIRLLQDVLDAIYNYKIFGSEDLKEVYVKARGEIAGWEKELSKSENKEAKSKLMSYVKDYGILLSALKTAKDLLESGWEMGKPLLGM